MEEMTQYMIGGLIVAALLTVVIVVLFNKFGPKKQTQRQQQEQEQDPQQQQQLQQQRMEKEEEEEEEEEEDRIQKLEEQLRQRDETIRKARLYAEDCGPDDELYTCINKLVRPSFIREQLGCPDGTETKNCIFNATFARVPDENPCPFGRPHPRNPSLCRVSNAGVREVGDMLSKERIKNEAEALKMLVENQDVIVLTESNAFGARSFSPYGVSSKDVAKDYDDMVGGIVSFDAVRNPDGDDNFIEGGRDGWNSEHLTYDPKRIDGKLLRRVYKGLKKGSESLNLETSDIGRLSELRHIRSDAELMS